MTDPVKEVVAPSYLDMSDEDMLNATLPVVATPVVVDEDVDAGAGGGEVVDEVVVPAKDAPVVADPAAVVVKDPADEDEGDEDDAGTAAAEAAKAAEAKAPKKDAEGKPVVEEVDPAKKAAADAAAAEAAKKLEAPVVINYEAEYKRLLAPFKANGREVEVKTVDDAIALMQMGANYNKKMAGLKPNLKLMKMLDNNGLLSEEKISFLIELDKKSPDAINKLVKESGLNPMDFDADKAGEYKPKIHAVDEREMELDTVLDDLQGTPSYNRTLAIVSKEWDGASKQIVAAQPQLLRVINDHVERGIYDLIVKEVESEKLFGRLNGMSDFDAYRMTGDAIDKRGGFNHLGSTQGKTTPAVEIVAPKPKKVEDAALNEKRRAASSSRPVVSGSVAKDYNPLNLPDDEFDKLSAPQYR